MAKRAANPGKFHFEPSMRIVVLHGKDPYLIGARTREIADILRIAHGDIEQFTYDGEEAELSDVLDELRSYGLIQQHKFVVLDHAEQFLAANDRRRPAMEAYAKAPVDNATLLLRAETWRSGNLDKHIKKIGGMIFKIEPPDDATALKWCKNRVKKQYETEIQPAAAQRLVEQIGADLARLDVELAKLAAFVDKGGVITVDHVGQLVGLSREEKVWEIQSAIASGSSGRALAKLRELMGVSNHPETLVVWAICDLIRKTHAAAQLMREGVNANAASRQLRLFGDSVQPILAAAKRCDPARLAELFQAAIQTDVNNKSGFGDSVRSLEALTVRIADTLGESRR